ncbi:signal recognition particle-docking protein FtsY [Bartonella sp. CB169]|uniref:signal recognition particle-docking protein FtsY n=1 Tax=Bartonella sp. CB169 TaxID=3112257 RepID=UPI00300E1FB2
MTKSFIKKIFSFNQNKKKKTKQVYTPYETDIEEESGSTNLKKEEKAENKNIKPIKHDEKTPHFEKYSGKIIVTNTICEKKIEESAIPLPVEHSNTAWVERFKKGLALSSQRLSESMSALFVKGKLGEDTLQELEDILIQADFGVETATRIIDTLASNRYEKNLSLDDIYAIVADEIKKVLEPVAIPLELDINHKPHVILLVGVNGTGKTTTIGKLAAKLTAGGLKVMLAAGDTFRAAAIEQLHIWGERTGSKVISTKLGADSASLAFDAYEKAKKENSDVLIIDTAGRLQNKTELMDELAKIIRVLRKHTPQAPHTILQTLDATTGQNALSQVDIFREIAGVNGLIMTKLDGTARGGVLVAIAEKYKLPIYFVGIGESIEDLQPFSASDFTETIAGKSI